MDKAKLLALADFVEKQPFADREEVRTGKFKGFGFNMSSWLDTVRDWGDDNELHTCGTVACIGGCAQVLFLPESKNNSQFAIECELSIDCIDAEKLFYPSRELDWQSITPVIAAKCIRSFVETGKIDWEEAGAEPYKVYE